jgi:pimeloyl-ACP methyl ester carboxylesterase
MKETVCRRPVQFTVDDACLWGMLDEPLPDLPRRSTGVLLLNSDDGCRLGPNRLWIHLTRRLCGEGYPCLRFDYRGCGDSDPFTPPGEPEVSPPGDIGLADAIAAERVLREQTGVERVILVGICYGAEIALLAGARVPSVCGIVACSTGTYVSPDTVGDAVRHAKGFAKTYGRKLFKKETWSRLVRGEIHSGLILKSAWQIVSPARILRDRSGAKRAREAAPTRHTHPPILFTYGSADPLTARCLPHYRRLAEENGWTHDFRIIEHADHNYSSCAWAQELIGHIARFVIEGTLVGVDLQR